MTAAVGLASAASATASDFESVSLGLYSPLNLSDDVLGLTVTTEGYAQDFAIGLRSAEYGRHSMRRTKASMI